MAAAESQYTAVPILPFPDAALPMYVHVRQHQPTTGESEEDAEMRPTSRTLFVAGVGAGLEEPELHTAFSFFGPVDAVECSTVGGARVAHVVFEQMKGLKKALTVVSKGLKTPLVCTTQGAARSKVGLKAMIAEHRKQRPGNETLRTQVDLWMGNWEREKAEKERAAEAAAEAAEGWTLVTGKKSAGGSGKSVSASGVVARGIAKNKALGLGAAAGVVKHKAQVDDFYRFQKREAARDQLLRLREQFEQDKQKVAKLKAARKFKPC